MSETRRYFVKAHSVTPYSPANHTGIVNRRLIGRETVRAAQREVVFGTVEKDKGALPHSQPGIEQVCYMLEGRARGGRGTGDGAGTRRLLLFRRSTAKG